MRRRGSIQAAGQGRWHIRIELGTDAAGRRIRKHTTFRGSKKDAERELTRLLTQVDTGQAAASRETVASYLEGWLAGTSGRLQKKTVAEYRSKIRLYILPHIGGLQLARLRPQHLEALYDTLRQTTGRTGSPLSERTVRHVHAILHAALAQALRWQDIPRNPAALITAPRPESTERRVYSPPEISRLLEVSRGTRLYLPVLLALGCGLRRGEVCALRWSAVDFERRRIEVTESMAEVAGERYVKGPKSARGRRRVVMPELLAAALAEERERQRQTVGGIWVCQTDYGKPITPRSITNNFAALAQAAAVAGRTFHDLRHTHSSWLDEGGLPLAVKARLLGHSQAVAAGVYTHVTDPLEDQAAQVINARFEEVRG